MTKVQTEDFKYALRSMNSNVPTIIVETVNVQNGKVISNAFLELWKENMQQAEEGLTDASGFFNFQVKQIGIHYIKATKAGFVPLVKKINFTKGFLASSEDNIFKITIPLLKIERDDEEYAYAVLSTDGSS